MAAGRGDNSNKDSDEGVAAAAAPALNPTPLSATTKVALACACSAVAEDKGPSHILAVDVHDEDNHAGADKQDGEADRQPSWCYCFWACFRFLSETQWARCWHCLDAGQMLSRRSRWISMLSKQTSCWGRVLVSYAQ